MGQIIDAIAGMKDACDALNYPVVSGNASLYNETNINNEINAIYPTPTIGGVGLIEDYRKIVRSAFLNAGEYIIRIGSLKGNLNSSAYLHEIIGHKETTIIPEVNLESELRNGNFILNAIDKGWISSCQDVAEGGQLVTMAEMALASFNMGKYIGAKINIARNINRVFGEDQGLYIVTASEKNTQIILETAPKHNVEAQVIGETVYEKNYPGNPESDSFIQFGNERISVRELKKSSEEFFNKNYK